MIRNITFTNFDLKAIDMARYDKATFKDGIVEGCEIGITSNTITVGNGMIIASGRRFSIDGATSVDITSLLANGFIRLKLVIDTSNTENPSSLVAEFSTTTTFPALTQDDINNESSTGTYEFEICIVSATTSGLSKIESVTPKLQPVINSGWKLLGSTTGQKPLSFSIDSTVQEYLVWIVVNGVMDSFVVPRSRISSANNYLCGGYYLTASVSGGWRILFNTSGVRLNDCYIAGANAASNATIIVYYR